MDLKIIIKKKININFSYRNFQKLVKSKVDSFLKYPYDLKKILKGAIMFTGIIRYTGKIINSRPVDAGKRFKIKAGEGLLHKMEEGITSVAIDGACHTVESKDAESFSVFSSFETLKKTTIGNLTRGRIVNLELPVTPQTLLDGHLVQGHADGVGVIAGVHKKGEAFLLRFSAPSEIFQYLVEKDSIAVDGISLTIFDISDGTFQTAVIPETIEKTSLGRKKEGNAVNLEVNLFAKYSFQFLKEKTDVKLSHFFNS